MMVACQVVQQEMDVEVVLMSRLWIICISQVSTFNIQQQQEFPEISSPLNSHKSFTQGSLASPFQECDKTLPQIVTLPMILLSVYYLVK